MENLSAISLKIESRKCREIAEKLTRRADIIDELLGDNLETLISPLSEGTISLQSNGVGSRLETEIHRFKREAGSKITQAEACVLALESAKAPLTTEQMLNHITANGIPITMPKKHTHLAPVLSRKSDVFTNVGRGKWALAKWSRSTREANAA